MDGTSSIKYKSLSAVFRKNIEDGFDRGSAFVVYENGEKVFDITGGYGDPDFEVAWNPNTLTPFFGATSLPASFVVSLLRERGIINESQPVNEYQRIFPSRTFSLSDFLHHKSGFVYPGNKISFFKVRDEPELLVKEILNKLPVLSTGTQLFHFHTMDIILSDMIKRVDDRKRPLSRFFLEEIIWPLGIDIQIGISPTQLFRVARTYHATVLDALNAVLRFDLNYLWKHTRFLFSSQESLRNQAIHIFSDYKLSLNYNSEFVEVPLSSVNLFTNARALSKLLTTLLPSSTTEKSLFQPETRMWMLSPEGEAYYDKVLERTVQYTKSGLFIEKSPEGNSIIGIRDDIMGQVAFVDPARNLTFAYVTNHAHACSQHRDWIINKLVEGVYACL